MNISKKAEKILKERYLLHDNNGKAMENVSEFFHRVAECVAKADVIHDIRSDIDKTEDLFYQMISNKDFLPSSPTLMNAGKDLGQLASSFVIPVEDSIDSIFSAVKQCALINKSGAGMGFSFSNIRPEGSKVGATGETASGPLGFMKVFDVALGSVRNSSSDRHSSAGVLRIDHPDILKFIECDEFDNFNLYIGMTEKFMIAAENDMEYNLIDPNTGEAGESLNASEVLNKITDAIWNRSKPGIIFLDRINSDNVVPNQGNIEAVNSWGEQPLLPYESCAMGSINMAHMLTEKNSRYVIDVVKLENTIDLAVHFLDNVIDVNWYPLKDIEESTKLTRKIGIGIMGWADALIKMRIPYDSEEAVALGERLMSMITGYGRDASERLAGIRGEFPLFRESTLPQNNIQRNATITTIASGDPIAEIADCSPGIEPIETFVTIKKNEEGRDVIDVHNGLAKALKKRNLLIEPILRKIAENGSLRGLEEIPEDIKRLYVSAKDLNPDYNILMQAAFQKDTDCAVSKKITLDANESKERVREILDLAFKTGCKIINIEHHKKEEKASQNEITVSTVSKEEINPVDKQELVSATMPNDNCIVSDIAVKPGEGNLYVTVNYDGNGVCKIATSIKTHADEK